MRKRETGRVSNEKTPPPAAKGCVWEWEEDPETHQGRWVEWMFDQQ